MRGGGGDDRSESHLCIHWAPGTSTSWHRLKLVTENHQRSLPQSDLSIQVSDGSTPLPGFCVLFTPPGPFSPRTPPLCGGASLGVSSGSMAVKEFPLTGAYRPSCSSDFAQLYLAFSPLD